MDKRLLPLESGNTLARVALVKRRSDIVNALRILIAGIVASTLASISPVTAQQRTLKVVMHSDLKVLDPVWSGAYIVRNHGYLIYDTLFAIDEKFQVRPQMAESWEFSEDGLTTTI